LYTQIRRATFGRYKIAAADGARRAVRLAKVCGWRIKEKIEFQA